MNKKIKVMVVDDHPVVRSGIQNFLRDIEEIELIGEAKNGLELMALLEKKHADIVLVDFRMPLMNGTETLSKVLKHHRDTKVIIFSVENDPLIMRDLIRAGARAYIHKDADAEIYAKAIFEVYHYGDYISADQARAIAKELTHPTQSTIPGELPLTAKQVKILVALCQERSEKEIAASFSISVSTVHSHRKSIYKKTGAKNLACLVTFAFKHGLFKV